MKPEHHKLKPFPKYTAIILLGFLAIFIMILLSRQPITQNELFVPLMLVTELCLAFMMMFLQQRHHKNVFIKLIDDWWKTPPTSIEEN